MMGYDSLMGYFKTNFALMHHHKYSLTEIESMIPWERFVYIDLLKQHVKDENDKIRDQMTARRVQENTKRK